MVAPVLWPTNLTATEGVKCVYTNETTPPVRMDRDTILVGSMDQPGAFDLSISGKVAGKAVELKWTVAATGSNEDYNFLPTLVDNATPHHRLKNTGLQREL